MKPGNAAVLFLGALSFLPRQQQQPTYSVKVAEVQIAAQVKDKNGRSIADLQKEDFILQDEGKPQEIEYFARQSDLALTLGLLVDTSMSQRQVLPEERRASVQFFQQVLRPEKDSAFVISFDFEAKLLEDLTSDLGRLDNSLRDVELPRSRPAPGNRGRGGGGTVLYDAAFLAADEILRHQSGRKAIILLSDGVDNGSIEKLESAIEAVQRADTVIYSIRYYDENAYAGGRSGRGMPPGRRGGRGPGVMRTAVDGKQILHRLSNETGGSMFEVSRKLSLTDIFSRIQEEMRSQYIIGYTPAKDDSKTGFRHITLRTRDKNLQVACRSGYYPR
jgi:VWFA-related protein